MTESDLKGLLRSLSEYFGLDKIFSPGRQRQWISKVEDIPAESIPYIQKCIEDNFDTLPRNIPRHIRTYFYAWKSLNSSKFIDQPTTQCPECGGTGFIHCSRPAMIMGEQLTATGGRKLMEQTTYRCPKCDNWRKWVHHSAMEAVTRIELESRGYEVLDFN
jgi:hypothetical protein